MESLEKRVVFALSEDIAAAGYVGMLDVEFSGVMAAAELQDGPSKYLLQYGTGSASPASI